MNWNSPFALLWVDCALGLKRPPVSISAKRRKSSLGMCRLSASASMMSSTWEREYSCDTTLSLFGDYHNEALVFYLLISAGFRVEAIVRVVCIGQLAHLFGRSAIRCPLHGHMDRRHRAAGLCNEFDFPAVFPAGRKIGVICRIRAVVSVVFANGNPADISPTVFPGVKQKQLGTLSILAFACGGVGRNGKQCISVGQLKCLSAAGLADRITFFRTAELADVTIGGHHRPCGRFLERRLRYRRLGFRIGKLIAGVLAVMVGRLVDKPGEVLFSIHLKGVAVPVMRPGPIGNGIGRRAVTFLVINGLDKFTWRYRWRITGNYVLTRCNGCQWKQ